VGTLAATGMLALLLLGTSLLMASGSTNASPATPAMASPHATLLSTGPHASWAWGAESEIALSSSYVGAYNTSQALTGGNLTPQGAYIAVQESIGVGYAVYAVVNASTPSAGHLYVTVQAAEWKALRISIAASGTFPAAGTYGPNASRPLSLMNVSLRANVTELSAIVAYLNLTTGPNGSLSLNDEHIAALQGINISLVAHSFPNVTQSSSGNTTIRYDSGSIALSEWAAADERANFTPALPLVQGPLYVGKTWNASGTVSFTGTIAYANRLSVALPGGTQGTISNRSVAHVNATVPYAVTFEVTGTRTVFDPNGTAETDYVIQYGDGSGPSGVVVTDGLVVLPAAPSGQKAGVAQAFPEHPAAAPASGPVVASSRSLYSPHRGITDSQESVPTSGDTVTAAPLSPSSAMAHIAALGTPVAPTTAAPTTGGIGGLLVLIVVGAGIGAVVGVAWRRRHPY
jgi:hypothetical protein